MRLSRRSRVATAFIALISVLFMQLALAGYACPSLQPQQWAQWSPMSSLSPTAAMPMTAADHDGMDGCAGAADLEQPALCAAHAQAGDQSLDRPAQPDTPPAVAVALVPQVADPARLPLSVVRAASAAWLLHTPSPPLSIRHCCFRI